MKFKVGFELLGTFTALLLVSTIFIGCNKGGLPPLPVGLTPTPASTTTIPMGNYVVGTIAGSIVDSSNGTSPVTSYSASSVGIACNQAAVTNATVILTLPGGSTVTIPYLMTVTYATYNMAFYSTLPTVPAWTYTPGGTYSLSVSDILGTVSASLVAPGEITWSGSITSTLTATAAYPGKTDSAEVFEYQPNNQLTYDSLATNVGSPFNFPVTAFNVASSPATFNAMYTASTTQYFTGAATGSVFIWGQGYQKIFTK